jgi:hypothetical protein
MGYVEHAAGGVSDEAAKAAERVHGWIRAALEALPEPDAE